MTCQICTQSHPTVLHMKTKDQKIRPEEGSHEHGERHTVVSGFVYTKTMISGKGSAETSEDFSYSSSSSKGQQHFL